jgi:rubrerythrin
MPNLRGTKTEQNILTAFAGESQARNRYTYFAEAAKNEGFEQISRIFAETADQEREHAKRLFKFLEGGAVTIEAAYPAGVIGSTTENLKAAAAGEDYEWQEMYPGFAKIAREEGFTAIAAVMEAIAVAEKQHSKRYQKLKANVDGGKVFRREEKVIWRCINCGYLHEGTAAPEICPACGFNREYFELLGENW